MNGKAPIHIHPSLTFYQYDQQAITVEFALEQILLVQEGNQIYIEASLFRKFHGEIQRNHGIAIGFLKKHHYQRIVINAQDGIQNVR